MKEMAEFTALLQKYTGELGEEVKASLTSLLDPTSIEKERKSLELIRDLIRYEGFDPIVIARLLANSHARQRAVIRADPSNLWSKTIRIGPPGSEEEIEVNNDMEFSSDIRYLCLLFVSRGAAYTKILKKSSAIAQEFLGQLQEKYSISVAKRRAGTTLDSNTITIARMAAAFPTVTLDLYHSGMGRILVTASEITGIPDLEWPKAFLSPMIASMLPHTINARVQLLAMAVATDDLLHQGNAKTKLASLVQYMMASLGSTMIPASVKKLRCTNWGILNRTGGLIPAIENNRQSCIQQIRKRRPDDVDLERVISDLEN